MSVFRKFQQGSEVVYTGKKFAGKLNGEVGLVVGFVQGTDYGVVVSFGDDAFILDERIHLAPFKGKKPSLDDKSSKVPDVEKRVGVSQRRKRAKIEDDE